MTVERVARLSPDEFLAKHVTPSLPVIVTGDMESWEARRSWTVDAFAERFGHHRVPVYGDYFGPQGFKTIMLLGRFIQEHMNKPEAKSPLYVRWFTLFQKTTEAQKRFPWADAFFEHIQAEWKHPSFLPTHSYLLPFCSSEQTLDFSTMKSAVLAKALYLSPRGAITRLHKDPWGTDAVICQVVGRKFAQLWAPQSEPALARVVEGSDELQTVDVRSPDPQAFPDFTNTKPYFEGYLEPGEIIYLPSGWYHFVETLSDSISITWNFVHMGSWRAWYKAQRTFPAWQQSDIEYLLYQAPNRL